MMNGHCPSWFYQEMLGYNFDRRPFSRAESCQALACYVASFHDTSLLSIVASAGTAATLHSFTLAQLTKRMSLTRKNEEAAASLQESEEAAANLQKPKEFERV